MSQFLILLYDDEQAWRTASPEAGAALTDGHRIFGEKYAAKILGGNALESQTTATTIRRDATAGWSVTDGPFVESKEALGGYYLVEAADLDEAIAMAKDIPIIDGGVEVRPIMVFEGR